MERGAWQVTVHRTRKCWTHLTPWRAAVHGVAKSQIQLSDWTELKQLKYAPTTFIFQSLSHVWHFATPWTAAHHGVSCVLTFPWSLLKLMSFSWWCHPTISSSVASFFCSQSFPASGSFPMSQLFASFGQSIRTSASVLPMNIQEWFPLGPGLISLLSKGPKSLHQHHSSKASILWCSAFVMV